MILKLNLAITFFFGTIIAAPVEEDASYNILNIWKSTYDPCKIKSRPVWIAGVQKYHDDIIEAFKKFPGPLKDQADVVTTPFQNFLTKLVNYSNSNSTVLSIGSIAILEVLNKVKLQANTPEGVIKEFYRVLPFLTKAYGDAITKLSKIIGEKASFSVNADMADLEREYTKYMKEFLQDDEHGLKRELDYGPITKSAEKFTETIQRVARASKCDNPDNPDIDDASTVLDLILEHLMICYYGLSGTSQAILYEQKSKQ